MTSNGSLIGYLESQIDDSNVYRVVDTYRVFSRGTEIEVRIMLQHDVSADYSYLVEVENLKAGEKSQHGNGGASPEEALDVFHWQTILPRREEH